MRKSGKNFEHVLENDISPKKNFPNIGTLILIILIVKNFLTGNTLTFYLYIPDDASYSENVRIFIKI